MNTSRRTALSALAGSTFAIHGKAAKKATAFALIGDRYHNSDYVRTALTRTIAKQMGVSIDFTDETPLLNAETLQGYKVLIVLRDGMIWPDGYGGDESTNAAWVATNRPKLVFDPTAPGKSEAAILDQAGARQSRTQLRRGRRLSPLPPQHNARRPHRPRFPPRTGRSLHRPPSDPHL